MYINPILVGVLGTLLVETVLIVIISLWRNRDENNDNEGNK